MMHGQKSIKLKFQMSIGNCYIDRVFVFAFTNVTVVLFMFCIVVFSASYIELVWLRVCYQSVVFQVRSGPTLIHKYVPNMIV
jgi:hypothetical protein